MSKIIELTLEEQKEAVKYGNARRDSNLNGELKDTGHSGKPMGGDWRVNDIIAAGAEIAAAKYLGQEFTGKVNTFHKVTDVSGGWQVRCTDYKTGCLIIRQKDIGCLDDKFLLVIHEGKERYRIAGYKVGKDCINPKYLRNPGNRKPAYFVPQSDLLEYEK